MIFRWQIRQNFSFFKTEQAQEVIVQFFSCQFLDLIYQIVTFILEIIGSYLFQLLQHVFEVLLRILNVPVFFQNQVDESVVVFRT